MRTKAFFSVSVMVLMGAALWTQNASACGGFFCNNSSPVDQSGERILFSVEGTTVTAHIQIQYQGPAESFSWVLPLPSVPDVTVGTDMVFTRLRAMTDPRFELEWQKSESCKPDTECWDYMEGGSDGAGVTGSSDGGPEPTVNVLAEGEAGPYNYKVLEADTGQVLYDWLNDNGYDQPEEAQELIEHYVNQSFKFVALKLLKNKDAGEIQPLIVRYTAPNLACIPIKLTSISATPNMPVWSWVLAKSRAIPINFFHVLLNPKAYDWVKCAIQTGEVFGYYGGNSSCAGAYMDLVTKAVDTANGHAFVTEYAGSTEKMKEQIYKEGQFDYLEQSKQKANAEAFLDSLFSHQFPNSAMFQQLVFAHIPKPDNLPENCDENNEFYNWNMKECLQHMPEGWVFDPLAFVADIEERIVKPLKDAQAMFDMYPYMTRMFTTLSPDEMSKDPVFSFNADLGNVSNVHVTKATPVCKEGTKNEVIGANIEYANGDITFVAGKWQNCGFTYDDGGGTTGGTDGGGVAPASEIQVMSETGPPKKVEKGDLDAEEAAMDIRTPDPNASDKEQDPNADGSADGTFGTPVDDGGGTGGTTGGGTTSGSSGGSSSGCSTGLGPAGAMGWILILLMLGFYALLREERQ